MPRRRRRQRQRQSRRIARFDFSPHLHRAAPSSRRSRSRSRSPASASPASPIASSALRRVVRALARSHARRTRPPIATTSADAPERRSRRASGRKPGVPSGDAVSTLIIPVTFPYSTRHERRERYHARRRAPTPRIASSPATRAFVSARVRRRGRVSVVSSRRGAASTHRHSSASARVRARQSAASDAR